MLAQQLMMIADIIPVGLLVNAFGKCVQKIMLATIFLFFHNILV